MRLLYILILPVRSQTWELRRQDDQDVNVVNGIVVPLWSVLNVDQRNPTWCQDLRTAAIPSAPAGGTSVSTSTTLPCNAEVLLWRELRTFSHVMCSKVRRGGPKMGVQWNHCLRTYCNKNFRGWIAGFNPFCQLIGIRTLGHPGILAAGSCSPLMGINIPNIDY